MTVICAGCDARGDGTAAALPAGWMEETSVLTGATFLRCGNCAAGKPAANKPTGDVAADRLRLLIDRILRLEEEKQGISDDIRDVYQEGKATGYDVKTMRQIVKLAKLDPNDRAESLALLETYLASLGMD